MDFSTKSGNTGNNIILRRRLLLRRRSSRRHRRRRDIDLSNKERPCGCRFFQIHHIDCCHIIAFLQLTGGLRDWTAYAEKRIPPYALMRNYRAAYSGKVHYTPDIATIGQTVDEEDEDYIKAPSEARFPKKKGRHKKKRIASRGRPGDGGTRAPKRARPVVGGTGLQPPAVERAHLPRATAGQHSNTNHEPRSVQR